MYHWIILYISVNSQEEKEVNTLFECIWHVTDFWKDLVVYNNANYRDSIRHSIVDLNQTRKLCQFPFFFILCTKILDQNIVTLN